MLTGQNGIINRAQEAKTKTGVANEKEAVKMAALEALTEGNGKITKDILTEKLKSYLEKNDIELTGEGPWLYKGTEGAYSIAKTGKISAGWICIYDANGVPEQVTNGTITLNIGDYINYNPGTEASYTAETGINQHPSKASDYQALLDDSTNASIKDIGTGNATPQTFTASSTPEDLKWRVLGADEYTGELLIFAIKNVGNLALRGITGYRNGIKELDNICNAYGQGKGATGGKSITYEEIAKAIGRPVITINQPGIISWGTESLENRSPAYIVGGTNGYFLWKHFEANTNMGIFNYYDVDVGKWVTNEQDLTNVTEEIPITTLTNDWNGYNSVTNVQKATKGYDVVFKANGANIEGESLYWIGSSYRLVYPYDASWGMYYVLGSGHVKGNDLYGSNGFVGTQMYGVRPVVSLEADIQLEKDATVVDTYNIK